MEELLVEGSRVVVDVHKAKRPKAGVLLVHGFNSCAKEFGDLPEQLASAGFTALALDLRGHGRSDGERGRVDLQRASKDIDAGLDALRGLVKKKPLAVIGHSLGGALALGHASRTPRASALVIAHPVDRLFDELGFAERAAYHVVGRIGQKRRAKGRPAGMLPRRPRYDQLFMDEGAAIRAAQDAFLNREVNVGNYAFATTMQAADWAAKVRVPVLAITSPHDKTVQPAHSEAVIAALAGPVEHCSHTGGHSCWRDRDGPAIQTAVIGFLRRHLEA